MLFLLRIIGGWAILAAVIALVDDVTRSYQTGAKLAFASVGKDWAILSPSSLAALQAGVERHVSRALWDPVILSALKAPAFAVFAVVGIALYLVSLRRRRLNIYAN